MVRTSKTRARRTALLGASALALVFAAAPERAAAQTFDRGFQGTPAVDAGSATVTIETNATTVNVTNPRTVVTWTPTSPATTGTIDFLPSGTSTTFVSALDDYTILNRIVPGGTATIGLNGSIRSFVTPGSEQLPVTGGNVWLYTPNGFVIGGGAVINVGGLLLTTNDVIYSNGPNGVNFTDANGALNLRGPAGSTGSIVNNGTITANTYVAMVAPRVEQRGLVSASNSIAYVAGEQVDLTINAGLFGITVLTGTSDANGIVHTGTTTGSASTGFLDAKTVSFVAIPKNEAMTMLLSGRIGYDPAANVFSDGASIVLTVGDENSPEGNIRIGEGEFTSRVSALATGDITVAPEPPGPFAESTSNTIFRSFTELVGEKSVHLTAAGGTRIQADNSISLRTGNDAAAGAITVEAFGGGLQPGTIAVSGTLEAIAEHSPGGRSSGDVGENAQGGTVTLHASGGVISTDRLYVTTFGQGGPGITQGGDGTGGAIELAAGFGGTITTGSVELYATGDGGRGSGFVNDEFVQGRGGVGRGGTITITDSLGDLAVDPDGGTLNLGDLTLSASAVGGNADSFDAGLGGDAFGGTIDIVLDRRDQSFGSLFGYAQARDGNSSVDPVGGDITMTVGGGISVDFSQIYLDASALIGINVAEGAFARGGTIDLSVIDGAILRTEFNLELTAGARTLGFFFDPPSSTADVTGGDITVLADSGTIEAGAIYIDVEAENFGATTRAGFARGGTVSLTAANGGTIGTRAQDNEATPEFVVSADAYTSEGVAVGESRGGDITLAALSGGTIAAPGINIVLEAAGETGIVVQTPDTNGAPAYGGTIAIDAIGGAIDAPIEAYAFGEGGTADLAGGSGTGGSIAVRVLEGGSLTGPLAAQAYGRGGQSLSQGDGGDGIGGAFTLASDALADFTAFSIDFQGYGEGGEAASGAGGDGYGGTAQVDLIGGEINWSYANFNVSAGGAQSQGPGSLAGSAFGDEDGARFHLGGGASFSISDLYLDASAYADANGDGNEAVGGAAGVLVDGGANLNVRSITVGASGYLLDFSFGPNTTESTPTVRGGTASLIADGGSISSTLIEVVADADTAGALTSAGSATGGTAIAGAANGGSILVELDFGCEGLCFGGLQVHADAFGAEGPSAANAFGGTATVYTQGGTITSPYGLTVSADALAGSYAGYFEEFSIPSNGFDATGGTASLEMRSGGSGAGAISTPFLTISAQGRADDLGSVAGTGGKGTGGTATLSVAEGDLVVDFGLQVIANGYGGTAAENQEGTTAFAGGDGEGGTATFDLSGGSVTSSSVSIEAIGQGANGESFNQGSTASLAGDGAGGDAIFRASGGALITLGFGEGGGDFTVNGSGFGGQGAFDQNGGVGGAGGSGTGGSALFEAPAGSTASLDIGVPISVLADGVGGGAGFSTSETYGAGGSAAGGDAAMRIGDIPFAFGHVFISGSGYGGFGATSGVGNGGSAEFSLIDSGNASAARSLGLLTLYAIGVEYDGVTPSGTAGTLAFAAQAGNPDAGMTIGGDLLLDASGAIAPAGNGFTGSISGAPVTVGGTVRLFTPRDAVLNIATPGALAATGDLSIDVGRTFTNTGAISTLANASVVAPGGISMTDLSSGGTTLLQAVNGPVTISNNLVSSGLVTVLGRSVNLVSLGALSFADADATAGNLSIRTVGDLDVTTVDATGAVTLTSTAGKVHNTGPVNGTDLTFVAGGDVISDTTLSANGNLTVDAGGFFLTPSASASATGNVSLSADLGLNLASVVSGGTTLLQSDAGAVNVTSLTSPGAVTALGRSVTIASLGALTFTSAQATAGNLQIATSGALTVGQGGATGTTSLTSATAAVNVTNLLSGGLVTARGTAVSIGSSGALSFADLDATAGNVSVQTAGNVAVNTVDATGSITLVSTGGSLSATGALNGVGLLLSSFNNLTLSNPLATSGPISLTSTNGAVSASSSVSSGGNLSVSGLSGITLGVVTSGGATALSASNGTVAVTNLASAGAITATGRAVTIGSTGALSVASAQATSGNLAITTGQGLTVGSASASGTVALNAGGNLATTGAITGAGITLGGTNVTTGGAVQSSGALALNAQQLLTINGLATGTAITATSGDITIGSTGRLGSRGLTQTLRIMAQSTSAPLNFGGTGTSGQFSLDQAEAARLFADQSITLASGTGDIRIGALAMSYGTASTANIGGGGRLKVDTAGNVTVNGAVALTTSSASDTFSIDPQRIEVIAGSGSVAMLGSGGTPLGTLILEGGTIIVADQSVIAAIGSSTDLAAINQLLDQPSAAQSDSGFLQAGSIDVLAGEALYIQNTGASNATNARRGFTASAFNIDTGSSSTRIAINGVITGPTGTLTGTQTINGMTINGQSATAAGAFDPQSTINGCLIGRSCTPQGAPTSTDLESPGDRSDGGDTGLGFDGSQLVMLADNEPLITPPLVDEPITGVGNDDLWQVHCDPEEDKGECPAGEGETEE